MSEHASPAAESRQAPPRRIGLAELLRPAHLPSPEARAAAREADAYRRGHAAAEAEGQAALADAEARRLALLAQGRAAQTAAADALLAVQLALEAAFAESLAAVALAIARAVLGVEPATTPAMLRALADELVAGAPDAASARVRAAPQTLAITAPLLPAGWASQSDPSLPPGTLLAELDGATLTASLETRLDQIAAVLTGSCS